MTSSLDKKVGFDEIVLVTFHSFLILSLFKFKKLIISKTKYIL